VVFYTPLEAVSAWHHLFCTAVQFSCSQPQVVHRTHAVSTPPGFVTQTDFDIELVTQLKEGKQRITMIARLLPTPIS
jgi:hypothetical protein